MNQYTFILFTFDGFEIDRTIVNAENRTKAIKHMRIYLTGGKKFKCFIKK